MSRNALDLLADLAGAIRSGSIGDEERVSELDISLPLNDSWKAFIAEYGSGEPPLRGSALQVGGQVRIVVSLETLLGYTRGYSADRPLYVSSSGGGGGAAYVPGPIVNFRWTSAVDSNNTAKVYTCDFTARKSQITISSTPLTGFYRIILSSLTIDNAVIGINRWWTVPWRIYCQLSGGTQTGTHTDSWALPAEWIIKTNNNPPIEPWSIPMGRLATRWVPIPSGNNPQTRIDVLALRSNAGAGGDPSGRGNATLSAFVETIVPAASSDVLSGIEGPKPRLRDSRGRFLRSESPSEPSGGSPEG